MKETSREEIRKLKGDICHPELAAKSVELEAKRDFMPPTGCFSILYRNSSINFLNLLPLSFRKLILLFLCRYKVVSD